MESPRARVVTTSCGQMVWKIIYLLQAKYLTMVAEVMAYHIPAVFYHALHGECKVSVECKRSYRVFLLSCPSVQQLTGDIPPDADFPSDTVAILTEMISEASCICEAHSLSKNI